MKKPLLLIMGLGIAALPVCPIFGQTNVCPGTAVTFTSSNTPGGVLPSGTTLGLGITVKSGSSVFLTTEPDSVTYLVSSSPGGTPPAIVIDSNFKTNIGDSGLLMIFLSRNCGQNPQAATDSARSVTPAALSTELPLLVYPTITNGQVTITGAAADLSNAAILVTDESGRAVYRSYNEGSMTTALTLNLGNLVKGIYFVRVSTATKIHIEKIIIQK